MERLWFLFLLTLVKLATKEVLLWDKPRWHVPDDWRLGKFSHFYQLPSSTSLNFHSWWSFHKHFSNAHRMGITVYVEKPELVYWIRNIQIMTCWIMTHTGWAGSSLGIWVPTLESENDRAFSIEGKVSIHLHKESRVTGVGAGGWWAQGKGSPPS